MNRTFLMLLLIGTALVIATHDDKQPPVLPGNLPWEVKVLSDGNVRVFGITLNKTRIQDANQILASFPKTQFITSPGSHPGLYAVYDQINLGGFPAHLELQYDVNAATLTQFKPRSMTNDGSRQPQLSKQLQLALLDSRVKSIVYKPATDYTPDLILQHFGKADEQHDLGNGRQCWVYGNLGLKILVRDQGPEEFIYAEVTGGVDDDGFEDF